MLDKHNTCSLAEVKKDPGLVMKAREICAKHSLRFINSVLNKNVSVAIFVCPQIILTTVKVHIKKYNIIKFLNL